MTSPRKPSTEDLARELLEACAARSPDDAPASLEEELAGLLRTRLAGAAPEEAAAALASLHARFPTVTHERDGEILENRKQLKQLQVEIARLRDRLDDKLKQGAWSFEIGAELTTGVLQLLFGAAANLDYELRDRPDDFAARLCDSVRILLLFTQDLSGRLAGFVEDAGGWKEAGDPFKVVKDRLMSKTDPGPGPLEASLEETRRKLPIILAAHHKATIEGARRILKELSPARMEETAEGARLKGRWKAYAEAHERVAGFRDYQLYKQYFEAVFKSTIKEEGK